MKILAISGSLRKGSYNTALVRVMQQLAPDGMEIEIADWSALPIYNEDIEMPYPAAAQSLKDKIVASDGIIIATPEYNRSMPGGLKNAIDWMSRPMGTNPFLGKPVLTAGVAYGKIGTAIAQSHLRHTLLWLNADVIGQPELYLGPAAELFDTNNELTHGSTKELLVKALTALVVRCENA